MQKNDEKDLAQETTAGETPETTEKETEGSEASQAKEAAEEKTPEELLQEQCSQLNDKYMRILAEYDNFRKRSQREKEEIYPRATAAAVEKFLPIIDNFERAMASPCADETFKKGIEMIFQSFLKTMEDLKVEEIGKEGEPFDPQFHNAVMHVEDENYGENIVTQVLQKGYRIGDKVVRYAMVQVAN
mgnify:FL=1